MSADGITAEAVLVAHQRLDIRSCLCGWDELGKSHAAHQVAALAEAGLLADGTEAATAQSVSVCSAHQERKRGCPRCEVPLSRLKELMAQSLPHASPTDMDVRRLAAFLKQEFPNAVSRAAGTAVVVNTAMAFMREMKTTLEAHGIVPEEGW